MGNQSAKGLERLLNATIYSWQGLKAAYQNEAAFRQELLLALCLIPAGLWLGETGLERAMLIGPIFLVLIVELLNSGIEAIVDRHGQELHELSGRAKDVASAAVLLSLINVCIIWALVLLL
ncbi:MAG: diacylglycerol kinase [Gammaproteobacteria bacterium RIFCSPLOWO2_12_FULL_52_10]|nr:MAG: diacylglycerol kinase [Gammaproteobacteria bacterium RIFCSPLOWO2_12_FULL_52_10]